MRFVPVSTLEQVLAVALPQPCAALRRPTRGEAGDVVFYISGHGFGHASRDDRGHQRDARAPNRRANRDSHVGREMAVRADSSCGEPGSTVTTASRPTPASSRSTASISTRRKPSPRAGVHGDFRLIASSARSRFSAATTRALVMADIPPLGIAAAPAGRHSGGRPGQFHLGLDLRGLRGSPRSRRPSSARSYATAAIALRLPMHGGFETFRRSSICRLSRVDRRASRAETRRALKLPEASATGAGVVRRLRPRRAWTWTRSTASRATWRS